MHRATLNYKFHTFVSSTTILGIGILAVSAGILSTLHEGDTMGWIWILIPLTALSIPIVAIIAGIVEKYMKAQEKQANLMTEEFIAEMTALRDEFQEQREVYERRIANLEAIVTAQAGEVRALPEADRRMMMPDLQSTKDLSDREKVALLARKLK
jgi:hypothetical protein